MRIVDNHDIWRDYDNRSLWGCPRNFRGVCCYLGTAMAISSCPVAHRTYSVGHGFLPTCESSEAKAIYKGTFKNQNHYYGYDGRGTFPTKFDCDYGYNLGVTAFGLLANGCTGYMAAIKDLHKPLTDWQPIGIPLAPLMHLEERKGRLELVIAKQKVDLASTAFQTLAQERAKWAREDHYRFPGPIQFYGPCADAKPISLQLNALEL